ncbi:hypothetical protein H5410_001063 [Solanum commersonii]|uniref:Uncharacterized protein n=1 Tax=Solanum commersonii TaxID=4109 RepID=A0A9J6AYJ3_SOLCO|nr:hypothetical protein H5410_001063 [Solanum commersonii]
MSLFAESLKIKNVIPPKKQLYVETLSGDLSLARRNSLLRFSEKPKTRLDCDSENGIKVAPLTIFYDGKIAIFDVSRARNFMLGVLANRKERFCPSRFGAIKIMPLSIFYNEKVAVFDVRSDKDDYGVTLWFSPCCPWKQELAEDVNGIHISYMYVIYGS